MTTASRLRTDPPGELPCGFYALPPERYGVLVSPTAAEWSRWLRGRRAYATVRPFRGGRAAEVSMDLCGFGDMPKGSRAMAHALLWAASYRYLFAGRGREVLHSSGVELWESFCNLEDVLPMALVLVELHRGDEDGARRLLDAWADDVAAAAEDVWRRPTAKNPSTATVSGP